MTVIRPNSVSGITSITAQANEINFFRSNGALAGLQLNGVNFNTTTGVSTFNNLDVGGVLTYQDVTNVDSVGLITARSGLIVTGVTTLSHTGANQLVIKDSDTSGTGSHMRISFQDSGGDEKFFVGNDNNNDYLYLGSGSGKPNPTVIRYAGGDKITVENSRVYINTSLEVVGSITASDSIIHQGDTDTKIRFPAADTISFETAGAERLRISSTGQLLVGTSSASNRFKNGNGNGATPKFQFETANVDEQNDISLTFGRNNAFGAEIILAKHRAATVGGVTVVQSGDRLGGINFAGSDGTHFRPAALIQTRVDGTPGTGDMPGRLEFHTTADGASTPTERVRITSTGQLLVNATTVNAGGASPKMAIDVGDSNLHGITIHAGGGENNGDLAGIAFGHGNTGDIARPKAAIAHNRTSSYGIGDLCFYVDGVGDNNAVSSGDERLRITADGNAVFTDKDSGHIGGGFYSRTKSVTGSTTTNFMRFTLTHGALAGAIYATASNNAYSISKSYTFAVQYGDGSNVNLQSDSGSMGGVDFIVSCSTSASTHTFRVQNTGSATIEVNLTVVVGCANQDITYTEL